MKAQSTQVTHSAPDPATRHGVPAVVRRRIVELACRAPSVHNTQPWRWRSVAVGLELHADLARRLEVSDPEGRNLVISCGAALHHAQVAAQLLGWDAVVERLPESPGRTLMARLHLSRGAPPRGAGDLLLALLERRTDRRRFTSWPVPDERLQHLATVAHSWGVQASPVVAAGDRFVVESLLRTAQSRQDADPRFVREQQSWVDRAPVEGVPSAVLPDSPGPRPTRFPRGHLPDAARNIESSDGLLLLFSAEDDAAAWLTTGEALSALWLRATDDGLAVVPVSQVLEEPDTRAAVRSQVLGGLGHPQLLARVGWLAISRGDLPMSPRRPVDEVLDLT